MNFKLAREHDPHPLAQLAPIGEMIKALRKKKSLTLVDLANRTAMSEATLSRIENGTTQISASNLYQLAYVFEVDVAGFFGTGAQAIGPGVRSVTRKGEGENFRSKRFFSKVLGPDISNKQMQPFINTVTQRTLAEAGGLQRHDGEEFIHVLEGELILHCEHYTPLVMTSGDSIYFDGALAHAYVCGSPQSVSFISVTTRGSKLSPFENLPVR